MKRFHIQMSVDDFDAGLRFYSALFDTAPSLCKDDYARWMLDDPRVNFSISARGFKTGVDHLGIQVETAGELEEVYSRLQRAEGQKIEIGQATCCYAHLEKRWIVDPVGLFWEAFLTTADSDEYGTDPEHVVELRERIARAGDAAAK
ncbi:MAG: glyoxalase/bleomycin resistance/dioxygenase family protein [Alphaproteobacteria bacterium]